MTSERTVSENLHRSAIEQKDSGPPKTPVTFDVLVERVNELSWRVRRSEEQVAKLAQLEKSMSKLLVQTETSGASAASAATDHTKVEVPTKGPERKAEKPNIKNKGKESKQQASIVKSALTGVFAFLTAAALTAAGYFVYSTLASSDQKKQTAQPKAVEKVASKKVTKARPEKSKTVDGKGGATKPASRSAAPKQQKEPKVVAKAVQPAAPQPIPTSSGPLTDEIPDGAVAADVAERAQGGNYYAQFEVGAYFSKKNTPHHNLRRAAHWMMKSAQQGYPLAQVWLASMYEHGNGVQKDVQRALYWYEQAARRGNVNAMFNLGVLKASGAGGKRDYRQAAIWMRQAADYGLKSAQYNLGKFYQAGAGVEKNYKEAARWFHIASNRGEQRAKQSLAKLEGLMSPDDFAEAARLAAQWQSAPAYRNANVFTPGSGSDTAKLHTIEEPSPQIDLSKDNIMEIQAFLNQLGFDAGTPDGNIGPKTKEAVRKFQKINGLEPTGEINLEFLNKLTNRSG